MVEDIQFTEAALVASICRDDFYEFIKEFWSEIIPEKPVWNWHMKYICSQLQKAAERVFKGIESPHDFCINVPPGTSKSTIISEMFPAWVWTRMLTAKFICVSHTTPVALDLARRCRNVLTSPKYKQCFPEVDLVSENITQIINDKGGFRLAAGTGGVTGLHAHFIIIDDPIDPQAAATEQDTQREKAVNWMTGTLSTRKIDKAVTVTILVMQRLHQEDPAAIMTGESKIHKWGTPVRRICLPWKLSPNIFPKKLRRRYSAEGLLDPIRLSEKVGEQFRVRLGNFGFSCQFEQSPVPLEGGMFKTDRIKVDVPARFKRIVRYWDKAGTYKAGCFTVGVKMGLDFMDRFWILDVVRGQWESDDREAIIQRTARLDGRHVKVGLEIEAGSGGKDSYLNTVRKTLAGFSVVGEHPTGDKAVRADPFSVQVNSGNVFCIAAPWVAAYLDELRFFPASSYKDQVDASSGAFRMLTNRITVGALFAPEEEEVSKHEMQRVA